MHMYTDMHILTIIPILIHPHVFTDRKGPQDLGKQDSILSFSPYQTSLDFCYPHQTHHQTCALANTGIYMQAQFKDSHHNDKITVNH